jgi:hypothetical protein
VAVLSCIFAFYSCSFSSSSSPLSPLSLCLSQGILLKEVDTNKINSNTFNAAQQEIFFLMERDSYPRFRMGPLFKELLEDYGVSTKGMEMSEIE